MEPWKKNLYIIWVVQVFSLMGFGFALPFIPFYFQELGVTDPERLRVLTGISTALPAALLGVMALVWGGLSDRIGRKLMMLRALLAGTLIIGGLGLARSVTAVLVLRAIQGMFTGTMTAAVTLVAAGTPKNRLSYALGLIASSNFIGFSFGPFIGGFTAELFGYRTSFFIGSGIVFLSFLLVLFGVKELGQRQGRKHRKVSGSAAEQAARSETGRSAGAAEQIAPAGTGEPKREVPRPGEFLERQMRKEETAGSDFTLRMIFRQPLLIGFILMFLMRFIGSFAQPFLPLYFQEMLGRLEGASAVTGAVTGLTGLATAIAGLTLVRLGDTHDKMLLIQIYLLCGAFIAFPLYLVSTLIPFSVFLVLTRFFLGGIEPMLHSIIGEHTPPERRGIVFGTQTCIGSLGWFFAPIVGSSVSVALGLRQIFIFHSLGILGAFFIVVLFQRKNLLTLATVRLRRLRSACGRKP